MAVRNLFFLLLLISCSVHAQIYKWVGPDGKMNYSDKPPPKAVETVETKSASGSERNFELPYELAKVARTMPVTLYSSDSVSQSVNARHFLMNNGIPFTEKTVSTKEDIDKFNQISGGLQIPVLFVGKYKLTGFSAGEWRTTLTQAGYPESNTLPTTYRFADPQPLVPIILKPKEAHNDVKLREQPAQPTRDPNAFQF